MSLIVDPCPFCGSTDVGSSFDRGVSGQRITFIRCSSCGACGPDVEVGEDVIEAETLSVAAWGARSAA